MDRTMTTMSGDEEKGPEGDRVEELLRVNAELAAELRDLAAGRIEAPRQRRNPASRGIARLLAERDSLAERLRQAEAELELTRGDRDRLERQNQEMDAEIASLRAGFTGLLRRARARMIDR